MKHSHNNDHIRKSKTDEHNVFKIEKPENYKKNNIKKIENYWKKA